jgi:hypothetical protein
MWCQFQNIFQQKYFSWTAAIFYFGLKTLRRANRFYKMVIINFNFQKVIGMSVMVMSFPKSPVGCVFRKKMKIS